MSSSTVRAGRLTIQFHYDGFNELRQSIQPEIDAFGERIAHQANLRPEGKKEREIIEYFKYEAEPNRTRARGIVAAAGPEGKRLQASHDTLSQAFARRGRGK